MGVKAGRLPARRGPGTGIPAPDEEVPAVQSTMSSGGTEALFDMINGQGTHAQAQRTI